MKKTLYIDIDCILMRDLEVGAEPYPIAFMPGLFQHLSRITNDLDYALVLCIPENEHAPTVEHAIRFCKSEDIIFEEVVARPQLIQRLKYKTDEANLLISRPSYSSIDLFENRVIYLSKDESVSISQRNWDDIYKTLVADQRKATVIRKTSETNIQCYINLDGSGQNQITTGLGFFDHMLQQIARHGNIDFNISVQGDLHIDEHHTIEDVGLALGSTFNEALGSKKGIERYGFLLPMDDCLAQVALDFGGRPWLVWEAEFKREKVGDMPTEMFYHFFKSFSDAARCNLNIKAEGSNEHHKIESIFKAFAKSIRMAITKNNSNTIPSTKGSL